MNFTNNLSKLAGCLSFAALTGYSSGAITLTIAESNNDVVVFYEGSVDVSGLTRGGSFMVPSGQVRSQFNLWFTSGASTELVEYTGGVLNFRNPGNLSILGSSASGFGVGFQTSDRLFLGSDYVSNTPIDGAVVIENETFSSLGLADGVSASYTWTSNSGAESVTLQTDRTAAVPPALIPEPSAALLLSLSGFLVFARKRKS